MNNKWGLLFRPSFSKPEDALNDTSSLKAHTMFDEDFNPDQTYITINNGKRILVPVKTVQVLYKNFCIQYAKVLEI